MVTTQFIKGEKSKVQLEFEEKYKWAIDLFDEAFGKENVLTHVIEYDSVFLIAVKGCEPEVLILEHGRQIGDRLFLELLDSNKILDKEEKIRGVIDYLKEN